MSAKTDLERAIEAVERRVAYWESRQRDNPPAHKFDITTEMASKLALLDILPSLRALKEESKG